MKKLLLINAFGFVCIVGLILCLAGGVTANEPEKAPAGIPLMDKINYSTN
ncbi:MAG: hypothetical protein GY874_19695 [Desulfobacteraceae bacterium]|nr:hypothetical protein [Desulfobacteraceae bacterium]